jgi:Family of unknown function (DUF5309)
VATVQGTIFGFTDTTNNVIDMSDTLASLKPDDVPILNIVGRDSLKDGAARSTKHEWLEDALRPLDGAVAADTSLHNTTDPVTFNVVAGQGVYLLANDILKVESELLRVTAVSTDAVTVARGFGGSTAAAHAASTAWSIVGRVDVQDAAVPTPRTTTVSGLFNYTQIYNASVVVTTTAQSIKRYTKEDLMATAVRDEIRSAWLTWERALIHGRKVAPSSGVSSAMDGFLTRISTNVYAKGGAALTEAFLNTALRDAWSAGGGGRMTAFLGAFQKERVNQILDSMRMTSRTDTTAGVRVNKYESDYGTLDFVLSRNMPTDTVMIIDTDRVGFGPLRGHSLRAVQLPRDTVSKDTVQIWGQYTSELRNETAHAKITGLATS